MEGISFVLKSFRLLLILLIFLIFVLFLKIFELLLLLFLFLRFNFIVGFCLLVVDDVGITRPKSVDLNLKVWPPVDVFTVSLFVDKNDEAEEIEEDEEFDDRSAKTVGKDSLPSPVASSGSGTSAESPVIPDLKIDDAVEDVDSTAPAATEADLNVFLAVMRNKLGQLYSSSIELENKIGAQVLPNLRILYSDIEKKQKNFSTISAKELKELRKLHSSSLKGVKKLDASVSEFGSMAITGKLDYSHDRSRNNKIIRIIFFC